MCTVEFTARLSSLAVVEVKGSQVLKVPLALPHNLETLVGLAGLLGQDVTVTITALQLTLDDVSDRGLTILAGGATVRATTWLNPVTGELQRVHGGTEERLGATTASSLSLDLPKELAEIEARHQAATLGE